MELKIEIDIKPFKKKKTYKTINIINYVFLYYNKNSIL